MNPKQYANLNYRNKEERMLLLNDTKRIIDKLDKDKEHSFLQKVETSYNKLIQKTNTSILYLTSSPYISSDITDIKVTYSATITMLKSESQMTYHSCCLKELCCKSICILASIYQHQKKVGNK